MQQLRTAPINEPLLLLPECAGSQLFHFPCKGGHIVVCQLLRGQEYAQALHTKQALVIQGREVPTLVPMAAPVGRTCDVRERYHHDQKEEDVDSLLAGVLAKPLSHIHLYRLPASELYVVQAPMLQGCSEVHAHERHEEGCIDHGAAVNAAHHARVVKRVQEQLEGNCCEDAQGIDPKPPQHLEGKQDGLGWYLPVHKHVDSRPQQHRDYGEAGVADANSVRSGTTTPGMHRAQEGHDARREADHTHDQSPHLADRCAADLIVKASNPLEPLMMVVKAKAGPGVTLTEEASALQHGGSAGQCARGMNRSRIAQVVPNGPRAVPISHMDGQREGQQSRSHRCKEGHYPAQGLAL
mmetsp:Transcript_82244/g.228245  ORF Transcript_82244/g.228245 Transcript_82244/m.228245 type:complete len:353 (-) Transcript_82244:790-1848(-)